MEVVRLRCLADPSFTCAAVDVRPVPSFVYQPSDSRSPPELQQPQSGPHDAHGAAPPARCPGPLPPFLQPNPANFAALRCNWTHPAVISLVVPQGLPGVSLLGGGAAGRSPFELPQPSNLWNSMLPAMTAIHYPVCSQQLQSLCSVSGSVAQPAQPAPRPLQQPNICVGHQDDWLELSPAMLALWPAVPFEPYAGQKPVQYFVLCPDNLQSQALLFIKDLGVMYELCKLGTHHSVAQQAWLYTFSTAHPPGSSPDPHSSSRHAWERLSAEQRYLAGLQAASEQLQRALLTSALELRQDGPALDLNLGAAPVVYIVCPFGEGSGQQEAALLEVACCLAPCTPAGASCTPTGSSAGSAGGSSTASEGVHQAELAQVPGEPATPEPGVDRHADVASNGGGDQPGVAALEQLAAAAGDELQGRYHGAAECLFQQDVGDCQQGAQRELPRGQVPPVDLTLQVVGPQCLSDLSGQAAKATAFELYTKIRRRPQDTCCPMQQDSPPQPDSPRDTPLVPFCSEPLFTLANASPAHSPLPLQPANEDDMPDLMGPPSSPLPTSPPPTSPCDDAPQAQPRPSRTLHCCYALPSDLAACTVSRPAAAGVGGGPVQPAPGSGAGAAAAAAAAGMREQSVLLVPVVWTDNAGELLHWEVLEVGLRSGRSSPERRHGSQGRGTPQRSTSINMDRTPHGLVCGAVAQRSVELLGQLRASAHPPNVLQHVAVARLGSLHAEERSAWEQLLQDRQLLLPDMSTSHHMAVVGVEAPPPARLATPSGPPGGPRVFLQPGADRQAAATLVLLPSDDPGSLTLPGENDVVRTLQLSFVTPPHSRGGASQHSLSVVKELYGLSVLTAAHFNLLWGSCTGGGLAAAGGGGPPPNAHLPFHAYLVGRMQGLVCLLCSGS